MHQLVCCNLIGHLQILAVSTILGIVEQIGSNFWWNRSLYDKSMKLGTQLKHVIRIILRYRAIADLTSDLYGSIFFQISDKIINFQSLILLIWHFFNCT